MAAETPTYPLSPMDLLIATHPNNAEAIPKLLNEVVESVNNLTTGTDQDRKDTLVKCRALALAIETPRETMVDHCWGQVSAQESQSLNRISDVVDGYNCGYRVWRGRRIMDLDGSEWR